MTFHSKTLLALWLVTSYFQGFSCTKDCHQRAWAWHPQQKESSFLVAPLNTLNLTLICQVWVTCSCLNLSKSPGKRFPHWPRLSPFLEHWGSMGIGKGSITVSHEPCREGIEEAWIPQEKISVLLPKTMEKHVWLAKTVNIPCGKDIYPHIL